jgi:hypothetical protein
VSFVAVNAEQAEDWNGASGLEFNPVFTTGFAGTAAALGLGEMPDAAFSLAGTPRGLAVYGRSCWAPCLAAGQSGQFDRVLRRG